MKKVFLSVAIASLAMCGSAQAESFTNNQYSHGHAEGDFGLNDGRAAAQSALREADSDVELRYGGHSGVQYRSNIYRQRDGAKSDLVGVVAPAFAIRTDFDKHEVQIKGVLEAGYYASEQDNNYVNADLQASSRLDIAPNESLDMHGRARYDNVEIGGFIEDIGNPQNRAAEPISYRLFDLGADYNKPLGENLVGRTGAAAQIYDYDNTEQVGGGKLAQDDRDRNEYYGYGLLGVPLENGLMPFVSVDANTRAYHRQVARTAVFGRDSVGFGAYVGAELNDKEIDSTWASGKIGFMNQNYDNAALPDINELGFDFAGEMMLAPNTILQAMASRKINENTLIGASGALQTRGQLGVVHNIYENWSVDANARYTLVDFQINPAFQRVGRKDDIYDSGLGVNYYVSNPLYLRADYQYINRNSTLALANYNESRAMISIGLKY